MNYMKQIAEMLGVELIERFKIISDKPCTSGTFRLTDRGIVDDDTFYRNDILRDLLTGAASIIKLPWKPKSGDSYWYYSELHILEKSVWDGALFDLALYKLGKLYRTREEAEAHAEEDKAYWNEIRKELEE